MPTEENKKSILENQLAQLLMRLKEAKLEEAERGIYARFSEFEILNEGIKFLENLHFVSKEDFASVKRLLEMEQYFLKSYTLRSFRFPDYNFYIHPHLLMDAKLDVQLDTLEMKADDLALRGHKLAKAEALNVVYHLRTLNQTYFEAQKIDGNDYKIRAFQIINDSRPVLEKHRGCKQILGNLLIFIATLGTGQLIHKALHGDFLFFKQTDSAKQIDALTQTINTYSL